MTLSARAKNIAPSITLAITAKAKAMRAQGIDVVGFGAGEPDFDTPDNIKAAAIKAINSGFTKYTAASGTDELKNAVVEKLKRDNGLIYDKSQVVVSCGAKHSLYNIAVVLFEKGDEVIIPAPYWVTYPEQVKLVDATPVIAHTKEEEGFCLTRSILEKAATKKTKAIILNSPCNPTGAVIPEKDLKEIADFAVKNNIFVISDECYEALTYNGLKHVSIASLGDKIKELTIVVNAVSKAYSMTGWRIGYTASTKEIAKAMADLQSQCTSNPTSIAQKAAEEALGGEQSTVAVMRKAFEERRNYMVDRLNNMPGVYCFKPQGAFYVFPNFSKCISKKYQGKGFSNATDFCAFLLEEAKVAAVPGGDFGSDVHMRLSYALAMDNIKKGLDRIEEAVKKLS